MTITPTILNRAFEAPTVAAMIACLLAACSGPESARPTQSIEKKGSPEAKWVIAEEKPEPQFSLLAQGRLCEADNTLHVRVRSRGIGGCLVQIPFGPRNAEIYLDEGNGEPVPNSVLAIDGSVWPWHELGLGLIGASPFAEASAQLASDASVAKKPNARLLLRVTILRAEKGGEYKRQDILLPVKLEPRPK